PDRLHSTLRLIWRHPTSTLFPYTTLFRSRHGKLQSLAALPRVQVVRMLAGGGWHARVSVLASHPLVRAAHPRGHDLPELRHVGTDRKSTRLNSSHLGISYAVFCLKKKTGY